MPTVNNIFNIKITYVANNGSINFGNTIQKGHTANQKSVGGFSVIGDGSLGMNAELSKVNDPDFADQPNSQV
ncbi:spore germination protein [Paenibacillus thermotolerans]|uniref:spore germination protein n=1 Tax=Paenibacillus thermotolerans TaxID=3027807 RepID=UPI00236889A0|nr:MULTISPECIES: spore germination protein [unclassified Paenibacillus]